MRATHWTLMLALGLGPAAAALAQTVPQGQQTARQSEPGTTAGASRLQAYALELQRVEGALRQAKEAAARAPAERQAGAVSQERAALARAGNDAARVVENAPPELADQAAYREARGRFRRSLDEFGTTQQLSGDTIQAAEDGLRILSELREQASRQASAAGANTPAPPANTGGGSGR